MLLHAHENVLRRSVGFYRRLLWVGVDCLFTDNNSSTIMTRQRPPSVTPCRFQLRHSCRRHAVGFLSEDSHNVVYLAAPLLRPLDLRFDDAYGPPCYCHASP